VSEFEPVGKTYDCYFRAGFPIEINDYNLIWEERSVISLAHITKKHGIEFLHIANQANLKASIEDFPFDEPPEVLVRVKQGKVKGNAVTKIAEEV